MKENINYMVAVCHEKGYDYCDELPFHPSERFPEYPFPHYFSNQNKVYTAVRKSLFLLWLDRENYGSAHWNPFARFVKPGDRVFIKPNMIAHEQQKTGEWQALITHGSVLRAVIDYTYIALKGKGSIVIADAPQEDSHIELIKERMGITSIQEFYLQATGFEIEFIDLRNRHLVACNGVYTDTVLLQGDPLGNSRFNLGQYSYFIEHDGSGKRYYGAFYDIEETNQHHNNGVHEYMISRTALAADVFISVPKLKTHKKVGLTVNLKSLVGINGQKNWLPHYSIGSPSENGDQFPDSGIKSRLENTLVISMKKMLLRKNPFAQFLAKRFKKLMYYIFGATNQTIRSGNWYGNDTCWRMTLDLNKILLYGTPDGCLRKKRKRYFSIVDGIIGMEGNGPVDGIPKTAGVIIAGFDPAAVDAVCASLMGLDWRKIPLIFRSFDKSDHPIALCFAKDIRIVSSDGKLQGKFMTMCPGFMTQFMPAMGWINYVEKTK